MNRRGSRSELPPVGVSQQDWQWAVAALQRMLSRAGKHAELMSYTLPGSKTGSPSKRRREIPISRLPDRRTAESKAWSALQLVLMIAKDRADTLRWEGRGVDEPEADQDDPLKGPPNAGG